MSFPYALLPGGHRSPVDRWNSDSAYGTDIDNLRHLQIEVPVTQMFISDITRTTIDSLNLLETELTFSRKGRAFTKLSYYPPDTSKTAVVQTHIIAEEAVCSTL